ncbi:hypothetical protein Salat_2357800 [Sesamum alatum]|uniref:Uncharacterized protein n=1 Tax=Sesamum alatum TaxID=300844 RepID=A0AAE2CEQ2_9LAMI|nr:hypothetical protein Salat_2357800 [Sesamum alatum]
MTEKALEKKQASTLPKIRESSLWGGGKEHPTQSGLSFPCFVVAHPSPPTSTPGSGGTRKGLSFSPLRRSLPPSLTNPRASFAPFLIEVAGLTPKAEFYGREHCNNNWAMRDFFKSCKRKGLLIELGGEAILVIRSEIGLAHKLSPLKTHYNIQICYAICRRLTTGNRGCRKGEHKEQAWLSV